MKQFKFSQAHSLTSPINLQRSIYELPPFPQDIYVNHLEHVNATVYGKRSDLIKDIERSLYWIIQVEKQSRERCRHKPKNQPRKDRGCVLT